MIIRNIIKSAYLISCHPKLVAAKYLNYSTTSNIKSTIHNSFYFKFYSKKIVILFFLLFLIKSSGMHRIFWRLAK